MPQCFCSFPRASTEYNFTSHSQRNKKRAGQTLNSIWPERVVPKDENAFNQQTYNNHPGKYRGGELISISFSDESRFCFVICRVHDGLYRPRTRPKIVLLQLMAS